MRLSFLTLGLVAALSSCRSDVVIAIYDELVETPDAGNDAGASDAGTPDAGAPDAGVDAGLADLALSLSGLQVIEVDAGPSLFVLSAFNSGNSDALDCSVTLGLPTGVTVAPPPHCTATATTLTCDGGTVAAGATALTSAPLRFTLSPRWFDLAGQVSSSSPELTGTNNQATQVVAVTPAGVMPIVIAGDRLMTLTFCSGTNITAFSQCVSGSQLTEIITLFSDGGIADDIGYPGFWGQSAHQRNLAFRFDDGTTRGASYSGGSVSAVCFEGVFDNFAGVANSGAWRGCLN